MDTTGGRRVSDREPVKKLEVIAECDFNYFGITPQKAIEALQGLGWRVIDVLDKSVLEDE